MAQVRAHNAPPPPPEVPGAHKKKGEESGGAIAMIDSLIAELDKEMTEAETEEELAQEECEELMADSVERRAAESKLVTGKGALKADTEDVHAERDWCIQYFDVRKETRTGEIDALGKAKAVLSGVDFSFAQTKSAKFLKWA